MNDVDTNGIGNGLERDRYTVRVACDDVLYSFSAIDRIIQRSKWVSWCEYFQKRSIHEDLQLFQHSSEVIWSDLIKRMTLYRSIHSTCLFPYIQFNSIISLILWNGLGSCKKRLLARYQLDFHLFIYSIFSQTMMNFSICKFLLQRSKYRHQPAAKFQ